MLNVAVEISGSKAARDRFATGRENIQRVIARTATEGGEQARTHLIREYRTNRSATSTGRISGNLAGSYGSRFTPTGPIGGDLDFGLLRSSAKGAALIYGPVHEFGATIRGKNGNPLKFKLADGSWRSPKQVKIPARPGIRPTADFMAPVIERVLAERIEAVL